MVSYLGDAGRNARAVLQRCGSKRCTILDHYGARVVLGHRSAIWLGPRLYVCNLASGRTAAVSVPRYCHALFGGDHLLICLDNDGSGRAVLIRLA